MEIVRADIPADCTVFIFGDMHFGAVNAARSMITDMIDEAAQRGAFLVNLGDNIEAITPDDKRYAHAAADVKNNLLTPQSQTEAVIETFRPVKDLILSWGEGNHEAKLWNTASFGQYISNALEVPYGGYTYTLHFYTNLPVFKWFISHGTGRLPKGAKDPIQRLANRKAHLRRKLEATGIADCILMAMGHTHQLLVVDPTIDTETVLVTTESRIKQDRRHRTDQAGDYISPERRWYVNTGGFLRLYSEPGTRVFSYAEIGMMEPTALGWVEVTVEGGRVTTVRERTG